MTRRLITPEQIDAILPQTQCGLCGHGACMPYAKAMAHENAPIDLCPPGGTDTLRALGALLKEDPAPYLPEMEIKAKPPRMAFIREAECIGCTKCIQACPVDAIIGAAKQIHTVLNMDCTGCELCVPACPVDCIDIFEIVAPVSTEQAKAKSDKARQRYQARQQRLQQEEASASLQQVRSPAPSTEHKQDYIQAAIARAKAKKEK